MSQQRASASSRLKRSLSGALLALTALACGKTTDATPRDVAMQLYVSLEAAGVRAMPESRALPVIEPYLTSELAAALRNAVERRERGERGGAGTDTLDTQRSIFSGLYEGYSTYHVRDTKTLGDTALVIMAFTNTAQKPSVTWSDTLVMVKGLPAWRVTDLRYGGNWDFGYRGSLRGVLTHAAASTSLGETSTTPPAPAASTR